MAFHCPSCGVAAPVRTTKRTLYVTERHHKCPRCGINFKTRESAERDALRAIRAVAILEMIEDQQLTSRVTEAELTTARQVVRAADEACDAYDASMFERRGRPKSQWNMAKPLAMDAKRLEEAKPKDAIDLLLAEKLREMGVE